MTETTRAALYLRVSTRDQSVEGQRQDLRRFIDARGWVLAGEYTDVGISGARQSRPELDKLMSDAKKRKFDVVLVWRFDRFARSTKHLLDALHAFRDLGIRFVSYQENIDMGSPLGEAMFTIVGAVGQLERDIIRERIQMGLRRARANDVRLGRPPRTAPVEEIRRLRARGMSIRAIAKMLSIPKTRVGNALLAVGRPTGPTHSPTQDKSVAGNG